TAVWRFAAALASIGNATAPSSPAAASTVSNLCIVVSVGRAPHDSITRCTPAALRACDDVVEKFLPAHPPAADAGHDGRPGRDPRLDHVPIDALPVEQPRPIGRIDDHARPAALLRGHVARS